MKLTSADDKKERLNNLVVYYLFLSLRAVNETIDEFYLFCLLCCGFDFLFFVFVCFLFVCLFVWVFLGEGRYKCKILKFQLWMLYYWVYRLMWEQRTITLVEIGVWHSRTHRRYNTKLAKLVVLGLFFL